MYTTLWATFLVAFVLSLVMTPAAIKLAPKIGAMDVPKDDRRMHVKAMPRFGGMAIFIGTMVSTAIFFAAARSSNPRHYDRRRADLSFGCDR